MEPGVYGEISNSDYHSGPGISKSGLDLIRRSPAHYQYAISADNDNQPTPAQQIGTAFHTLLLEPHLFDEQYALPCEMPLDALVTTDDLKAALKECGEKVSGNKPELIERLKAVRPDVIIADEIKQSYAVQNAGRIIIPHETNSQLWAMREAVMAHPAASKLMSVPGKAEQSVYWNDPVTGELCRCRPDWWRDDDILVDVKTTEDASPEEFARSILSWRYHVQDPFYTDGIFQAIGRVPRGFVFLVVEKKPPHAVAVYVLDRESRELGRAEYRADLNRYAECKRTGVWPAYADDIQPIGVPQWHLIRNADKLIAA